MSLVEKELALLRQPRIAALATSACPAWLWSVDGRQMVWANAVGAAVFGAAAPQQYRAHRREADDAAATQILRLAATLPAMAQNRLERLRGFGANFGRALTCICSRIVLDDGKAAVLVAAAEPGGPKLTPDERVRRLFGDCDDPIAAFDPDGTLVYANAAAQKLLGGARRLAALDTETIAAAALHSGHAKGSAQWGDKTVEITATRLGTEAAQVLVLTMPGQASAPADAPTAPQDPDHTIAAEPAVALPLAAQTSSVSAVSVPSPDAGQKDQQPDAAPKADAPATQEPMGERRHPLRFVWHMDADGRFGVGSDEFIELAGPHTAAAFGRPWHEIASELKLDPSDQVARAVASRETWSGITVSWPVDDSAERLPIEMSGLPVFDRDRNFRGYRGFGVCRDVDRLNQLARARREHPMGFMPPVDDGSQPSETAAASPPAALKEVSTSPAVPAPPPERPAAPVPANVVPANVVPFRPAPPAETKVSPTLSPVERRAFRELAQELTSRLRGPEAPAAETGVEDLPAEALEAAAAPAEPIIEQVLLNRIPVGVLVYRHDKILYANRHFLEWSGYASLAAIETAGGLSTLFVDPGAGVIAAADAATPPLASLSIATQRGETVPVQGRMFTVPWSGSSALALILTNGQAAAAQQAAERTLGDAQRENRELRSALDIATDGVLMFDAEGRVVSANARAAGLFGKAAGELAGCSFGDLLTPESEHAARPYFDRVPARRRR